MKTQLVTAGIKNSSILISSPQQYGQRGQIRSKNGMQRNLDREPEMELSHLRYDLNLNDPHYMCACSIHTNKRVQFIETGGYHPLMAVLTFSWNYNWFAERVYLDVMNWYRGLTSGFYFTHMTQATAILCRNESLERGLCFVLTGILRCVAGKHLHR